jgi:hypothetical protein
MIFLALRYSAPTRYNTVKLTHGLLHKESRFGRLGRKTMERMGRKNDTFAFFLT